MYKRQGFAFERYANQYTISFLGQQYLVNHPSGEIIAQDGEPIPLENSICILHYLVNATDDEIAGSFITFRELPSGFIYEIPFTNRCIRPLLGNFGSCPQKMVEAGLRLGGTAAKLGDYAVTVSYTHLDVYKRQGMDKPYPGIFIRAPYGIEAGKATKILSQYAGKIVLAQEGKFMACAFHPELTGDYRILDLWLKA